MKRIKLLKVGLLLALVLFVGSCNQLNNTKQEPQKPQTTLKSTQVNPETELMAGEYLDVIQEKLNSTTLTHVEKIRLIKESLELWGCTNKTAINWNPDAIYDDGSCEYYAEIPPNED